MLPHRGGLSMAMPNRDYLFYISFWGESKPHGFVFCRNFQFPNCAMLPSDAGFTGWLSQNYIHTAGCLAAIGYLLYKVFLQEFPFFEVCYALLSSDTGYYWQTVHKGYKPWTPFWEMAASSKQFFARIWIFFLCYSKTRNWKPKSKKGLEKEAHRDSLQL